MLQKLLAMLFSLILAVTGVVPPGAIPGLDAGDDASSAGGDLDIATHGPDGTVAGVNVHTLSVEGRTVEDDRWGIGSLDEISFQVGPQVAEGASLQLGDSNLRLHPTDTLTITDFQGRFRFTNVGTPTATILLDGVVHRTSVDDGTGGNPLSTETRTSHDGDAARGGDATPNAGTDAGDTGHITIANGQDNVAVERGASRSLRTLAESPSSQGTTLFATWVKVDGEEVSDYLHGDGELGHITFQVGPAPDGTTQIVRFDGEERVLEHGAILDLESFLGSYRIYQVENGLSRIHLYGAAANLTTQDASTAGVGGQPPVVGFTWTPDEPTTSHTVSFRSSSYDPDGRILLTEWRFGDGDVSFKTNPDHRFDTPGVYSVTLTVTDSDLHTRTEHANITVGNTLPSADFGWTPQNPTDLQEVAFTSRAWDGDGAVMERYWDLGDGESAKGRNVDHTYADDGTYPVTLTVRDDAGGWDNVTKLVHVRNVPPEVSFSWTPTNPMALEPVTFTNTSHDPDGSIVSTTWKIEGHGTLTDPQPTVSFPESGDYTVSLRLEDDDGDVSERSQVVEVRNRPPEANFTLSPSDPVTGEVIAFQDQSVDRDGSEGIQKWEWEFGDGTTSQESNPNHAYASLGTYTVNLTVTDVHGAEDTISKVVDVANAPPTADFTWNPSQPTDTTAVGFTDQSRDADDDIVSWTWDLGDGNLSTAQDPSHRYGDDGVYNVSLTVEDSVGHNDTLTRTLVVDNVPPTDVNTSHHPPEPTSRDTVTFTITDAHDPDGTIEERYWILPNGTVVQGDTVDAKLPEGVHTLRAVVVDDDGADTRVNHTLRIYPAGPIANFTWTPTEPSKDALVQFTELVDVGDAPIRSVQWYFGDGFRSYEHDPTHRYEETGSFTVKFRVMDENGKSDIAEKELFVIPPPTISFVSSPTQPNAGDTVTFNATAEPGDPDGTIEEVHWDFGDGNTATGVNVTHAYASTGTYDVTATVTDDHGGTNSTSNHVTVMNTRPVANFTYSPTLPQAGEVVSFVNKSVDDDGNIASQRWDFGDGQVSTATDPDHTYTTSAIYPVELRVTDSQGASDALTRSVKVTNDHSLTVIIQVIHPDGVPVDLTRNDLLSTFKVIDTGVTNRSDSTSRPVIVDTNGTARATFDVGEWIGGEPIQYTLSGGQLSSPVKFNIVPPAEASIIKRGPIVAPFLVRAQIDVDDAQRSPPVVPDAEPDPSDGKRYTDPTEPVNGTIQLDWTTGRPIDHGEYVVYMHYLGPDPDDRRVRIHSFEGTTDGNGTANFTVPFTVDNGTAAYLPGSYELELRYCPDDGSICFRGFASFVEDPGAIFRRASTAP